jgi:hypothetical protein
MSFDFDAISQRLARLDERLRPIAKGIVDLSDPAWVEKFRKGPKPLDQAGVRPEAEALLELLLASYRTGSPTVRTSIRSLFALNSSFTWATPVRQPITTEQGFRQALLKISAVDQAQDLRDTILHLNELSSKAEAVGVNTGPILDEVAALSCDKSGGQMGSMRRLLLRTRSRISGAPSRVSANFQGHEAELTALLSNAKLSLDAFLASKPEGKTPDYLNDLYDQLGRGAPHLLKYPTARDLFWDDPRNALEEQCLNDALAVFRFVGRNDK